MEERFAQLSYERQYGYECAGHCLLSYQLGLVLRLYQLEPHVAFLIYWRGQAHQRHGAKPAGFYERPDEEAVEVVVLSATGSFGIAQLHRRNLVGRVPGDGNDVIRLESL